MGLLRKYFKFNIVGVTNLSIKIGLTLCLSILIDPLFAYVISHIVILFTSYFMHSSFTFNFPIEYKTSYKFFAYSLLIKMADILVFAILDYFNLYLLLTVIITSLIFHFLRFYIFKNYIFY